MPSAAKAITGLVGECLAAGARHASTVRPAPPTLGAVRDRRSRCTGAVVVGMRGFEPGQPVPRRTESSNSVSAVQSRSYASTSWDALAQPVAADRRDPVVLLSLLLSAVYQKVVGQRSSRSARGAPPGR